VILQNGVQVFKSKVNSKEPYCSLTFDSYFKDDLDGALIMKNQEMMATQINQASASFSAFGLGGSKSSVKISMVAAIHDAKKAGYRKADFQSLELTPAIKAEFECKNLKPDSTIRDLNSIVGDSIFTIKNYAGMSNPYLLLAQSPAVKALAAQREAKVKEAQAQKLAEAEAKKVAEAAEKKRILEESLQALGSEANGKLPVTSLKSGNTLILGDNLATFLERSGYAGTVYQKGKLAGVVKEGKTLSLNSNPLDMAKPFCRMVALRMMASPLSSEVPYASGNYDLTKVKFYESSKILEITIVFKDKLEGAGVTESALLCNNVSNVDDLKTVLGNDTKIFSEEEVDTETSVSQDESGREINDEQESSTAVKNSQSSVKAQ
jgi:hypothetical protein